MCTTIRRGDVARLSERLAQDCRAVVRIGPLPVLDKPVPSAEVEIQQFLVGLGHAARQFRRQRSRAVRRAFRGTLQRTPLHRFQEQDPDATPLNVGIHRKLRETIDVRVLEPRRPLVRLDLVEQNHADDPLPPQAARVGDRGDETLAGLAPPPRRLVVLSPGQGTKPHPDLPRVRPMEQRRDLRDGIIGGQRADHHIVADTDGKRDRIGVRITHNELYADVDAGVRLGESLLLRRARVIPCFMNPADELPTIPRAGQVRIRVRYCECDPMGVVHHASYIPWLEIGRTELLREGRSTYARLEAAGVLLAVVRLEARYRRPARYDDLIEIRTRVTRTSRVKIEHEYTVVVVERDGEPCEIEAVGATSTLACIGRDGKPQELPTWLQSMSA